jgi:hypothetical protein
VYASIRQGKAKTGVARVACRIKAGAIPILKLPGPIDLVDGLRDVSARVLLLPHQCECHGIRTLDADAAREDRTVGIPHRLDLS